LKLNHCRIILNKPLKHQTSGENKTIFAIPLVSG
jgi:hypothetical protein